MGVQHSSIRALCPQGAKGQALKGLASNSFPSLCEFASCHNLLVAPFPHLLNIVGLFENRDNHPKYLTGSGKDEAKIQ